MGSSAAGTCWAGAPPLVATGAAPPALPPAASWRAAASAEPLPWCRRQRLAPGGGPAAAGWAAVGCSAAAVVAGVRRSRRSGRGSRLRCPAGLQGQSPRWQQTLEPQEGEVLIERDPKPFDFRKRRRTAPLGDDGYSNYLGSPEPDPRCIGHVEEFSLQKGWGSVSFARLPTEKNIPFKVKEVPQEFLDENDGEVPMGIPVEFDLGVDEDGRQYAYNLAFPAAKSLTELGLTREVVEGAASALGCDPRENPEAPDLIVPAPVQAEAIPKVLRCEDLVIAAETGSGKSLAYMLPLVQQCRELEQMRAMDYGLAFKSGAPIGLVICPTRELAVQACATLKRICHHARLRVRLVHGGTGTWKKQRREISQIVDILVATPDRLLKFYNEKDISFTDIAHVAIDEADFLLTQGFGDLQEILNEVTRTSKHRRVHYTLVTASITKPMWKIFQEDTRWSKLQVLESRSLHRPTSNCSHSFLLTKGRDKLDMLVQLLRPELSGNAPPRQTIVFCNTVSATNSVSYQFIDRFSQMGVGRLVGMMHKEMGAEERQSVLSEFARGKIQVIICTDIAQRGLDLPNVGHVVNFDFPLNSIDYLHRAGRTARYGEPGRVTSLIKKGDKYLARAIERCCQLGKPINNLSADKRDYLRGGALHELIARHPQANRIERGLPAPKKYDGGLR